jgi:hypothetical protein
MEASEWAQTYDKRRIVIIIVIYTGTVLVHDSRCLVVPTGVHAISKERRGVVPCNLVC